MFPWSSKRRGKGRSESRKPTNPKSKTWVILEPRHMEWKSREAVNFSEWVRQKIDEEIARSANEQEAHGAPAPRNGREGPGEASGTGRPESPEQMCEDCMEMGIESPALHKVRMNGKGMYLCKDCLEAAGFEVF